MNANIPSTISPTSSTACARGQLRVPPEDQAEHDHDRHAEHLLAELAHHLRADDRQPADRHRAEAVDHALGHVVGRGDAGADDPERERLADDPGEQVVLVAHPRDVDRRAEHVQEQQDEHDRLDRDVEQPLGHARDRPQAADGQQRGVADEPDQPRRRRPRRARARGLRSHSCGHLRRLGLRRRSGSCVRRVTGQREERVVERRAPERDLVDARSGPPPPPRRRGPGPPPRPGRRPRRVRCSARGRDVEPLAEQLAQRARTRSPSAAIDVDPLLADLRLELRRRAGGDLAAAVDQHDAVGERVRLLEVLGGQQQRDAVVDERADRRPHDLAAARIEPGGRLVEHEHVRGVDQARGEVDAAALAAGQVLDEPVAELVDREPLDQLVGDGGRLAAAAPAQPRHQHEVLARGEVLVERGELAGQRDQRLGRPPRRARRRGRRRGPSRRPGASSVASIRTVVVLPAPLGPSSDTTVPVSTRRSRSATAVNSPKRLVRPSVLSLRGLDP